MDNFHNEIIIVILTILTTLGFGIKDIIVAYSKKIISIINKDRVNIKNHNIFNYVDDKLNNIKYMKYSDNDYKNEIIRDYDYFFHKRVKDVLSDIKHEDINKISNIKDYLTSKYNYIHYYDVDLKSKGLSDLALSVFMQCVLKYRVLTKLNIESVIDEKIYDNNREIVLLFLNLLYVYVKTTTTTSILELENANGELKGDIYKGVLNK